MCAWMHASACVRACLRVVACVGACAFVRARVRVSVLACAHAGVWYGLDLSLTSHLVVLEVLRSGLALCVSVTEGAFIQASS